MKKLGLLIAIIAGLVCVILACLSFLDESPSPLKDEYEKSFSSNSLDLENNIAVYINAIGASAESKDAYADAKSQIQTEVESSSKKIEKQNYLSCAINSSLPLKHYFSDMQRLVMSKLEEDFLVCKFSNAEPSKCGSNDIISTLETRNQLLVDRYKKINEYSNFSQNYLFLMKFVLLQDLQRLELAKAVALAEQGKADEAYNLWLNNYTLNKKIISGDGTFISYAFAIAYLNNNLKALNNIIKISPELLKTKGTEISENLNIVTGVGDNFSKIVKNEYAATGCFRLEFLGADIFKNKISNFIIEIIEDIKSLYLMSSKDYFKALPQYLKKTGEKKGLISFLNLENLNLSKTLPQSVYRLNAEILRTKLQIALLQGNVTADGAQDFIKAKGADYNNPLTGEAFKYNKETKEVTSE
jgi:hypothetical protein